MLQLRQDGGAAAAGNGTGSGHKLNLLLTLTVPEYNLTRLRARVELRPQVPQ